jgi:hypothetical protein
MPELSKTLLLAAAVALITSPPAAAQVVRGLVVEADTRTPVAGAEVELRTARQRDTARGTTDSLGVFRIVPPRAGAYAVHVHHAAYVTFDGDSVHIGTGETVSIEVRLGRSVIPLDPLLVTARNAGHMAGFDERRRAGGFGRYLTREQIEGRGADRTTELLRGMPGVTLDRIRGRPSKSLIRMQSGLGGCLPAVWVDGVQVQQLPENSLDDLLVPGMVEAVEVYTSFSAAPAQFVSGVCGVVIFWTRRGSAEDGEPWRWKRMLAGVGAALIVILLIR